MSSENGSTALEKAERADLDLPVWDRKSDLTTQFAEHLEVRWRIAQMLAKSGMVREKRPEAIMAMQLKAYEIGLPLMQALSGMYFVDGKIALEGHLMDAMAIQRCGVKKTVHESSRTRCRMTLHREGWDPHTVEFSLEDAKRAGLIQDYDGETGEVTAARSKHGKPNLTWTKHTEEMLYWRALSKALKRIAPDFFGGVYTLDELGEQAEVAEASAESQANRELDALEKGVEPDPQVMEQEEVDQLRTELLQALEAGVIEAHRKDEILAMAIDGQWAECREAWEEVRRAMLEREVPEATEAAGETTELPLDDPRPATTGMEPGE